MKATSKNLLTIFLFVALSIAMAGNVAIAKVSTTTTIYIAPSSCSINLDLSNALPNGNVYGTVSLGLLSGACSGERDGVQIVVDANQSIFTTIGANFGLQDFGFNYSGNPDDLVITTSGNWNVKNDQNLSDFGIFMEDTYGTGSNRQDPLVINICNPVSNLMISDFVVANADGYYFTAHIANFTYQGYNGVNSAWFSTTQNCSPPPTTTVPTTTTTEPTTEISLASFTAKASNGRVKLEWTTETEIDNVGFNILRAEAENGTYVKLNDEIIPTKGSAIKGANYVFTDNIAKNRMTYFYKLQDIDVYGTSRFHGPVSATPKFLLGIFNK